MAAAILGLVEAAHLAWRGGALGAGERALLAAYAWAPYLAGGAALGGALAGLTGLWAIARRETPAGADAAWGIRATTGILTLGVFVGLFGLVALRLRGADDAGLSLTVATPFVAALSLCAWSVLGRLLTRLGGRISAVLGVVVVLGVLGVGVKLLTGGDGLGQSLGRWPPIFLACFGVGATALVVLFLRRSGPRAPHRGAWVLGLLGGVGVLNLVNHLDARPAVKRALLDDGLTVPALIRVTQPLFDADQDGYAGRLGGGDCDDTDPRVFPGAREVPRNGRDEDCFGGDSPGRIVAAPISAAPRARSKPVAGGRLPTGTLVQTPNLILITVDTLRADHLGYAGYDKHPISPNLDAIANTGLRFKWAFAQGAQTKQSMPSMFVGKYFSEVARTPHHWATTLRDNLTLAERLKAEGYTTIGVPAHNFFRPNYGLRQGFDVYDLAVIEEFGTRTAYGISGRIATNRALYWLKRQSDRKPWFLWLHLFDPHHFYKDHRGVDFGTEALDRYAEEVWYTDTQVGRLRKWLADSPFAENTYIMLSADHAEAFGEHDYTYHGQTLNNDQLHVPMFVAGPGIPSRDIATPVSNLDIVPTLVDLAGADPDPELRGVSLLRYVDNPEAPHPPVFAEMVKDSSHSARRMIVEWPYKLQWGITFNTYWLHDLRTDPTEQKNLAHTHKAVLDRMVLRLRLWMSEEVSTFDAEAWAKQRAAEISAERRRRAP